VEWTLRIHYNDYCIIRTSIICNGPAVFLLL
jgi:hypothetical protein